MKIDYATDNENKPTHTFFRTDKKPCKLIEGFSSGWKSTCKQKYVYRQFVAVRQSGGPPTVEAIPMPSSCCCHVKFTGDPEMRFGVTSTKSNRQSLSRENQESNDSS